MFGVHCISWDWQNADSSTVKTPFVRAAVGPVPTDRGKQGTKRSILCDRRSLPLALCIDRTNRHDSKLLFSTLDALIAEQPKPTVGHLQNLCLDAAYDHDAIYGELYERGYEPHVQLNRQYHTWYQPPQKEANSLESGKMPRRWVVERFFS